MVISVALLSTPAQAQETYSITLTLNGVSDVSPAHLEGWIIMGDEQADASSVIDILTLACPKGSIITVKIEEASDLNILEDIARLAASGFNEG